MEDKDKRDETGEAGTGQMRWVKWAFLSRFRTGVLICENTGKPLKGYKRILGVGAM